MSSGNGASGESVKKEERQKARSKIHRLNTLQFVKRKKVDYDEYLRYLRKPKAK